MMRMWRRGFIGCAGSVLLSVFGTGAGEAPKDPGLTIDIEVRSQGQETPAGTQLARAEWYAQTNPEKALAEFSVVIETWPDAPEAKAAQFGRGRMLYALERWMEAFEAVEASFPRRPISHELNKRNELELRIGTKLLEYAETPVPGAKGQGKKTMNGFDAASRVFGAVVYNDPEGLFAPDALRLLGDAYRHGGRLEEAEAAYRRVIAEYPSYAQVDACKLGAAGCLLERMEKGAAVRNEDLLAARELLTSVRPDAVDGGTGPDELATRLNEQKAAKLLDQAAMYLRSGGAKGRAGAVFNFREIVRKYPATTAAETARRRLDELHEPADAAQETR